MTESSFADHTRANSVIDDLDFRSSGLPNICSIERPSTRIYQSGAFSQPRLKHGMVRVSRQCWPSGSTTIKPIFPVASFIPSLGIPVMAGDYASQIIAYRHAHGLTSVRLDCRLNSVALQQACDGFERNRQSHCRRRFFFARGWIA